MRNCPVLISIVMAAGLAGCGGTDRDNSGRAQKDIATIEQAFAARVAMAGEGAGFADFLDPEEGKLFRNLPAPVKGQAAIRTFYGPPRAGAKLTWSPSEIIAAKSG